MLEFILAHRFGVARFLSILISIAAAFYMADGLGWYWYGWWPMTGVVYAVSLLVLGLFFGALWQRRRLL
jgi:hypothetical protein